MRCLPGDRAVPTLIALLRKRHHFRKTFLEALWLNPDFFSKVFTTKLVYSPAPSSNEQGRKWEEKFGKLQTGNLETVMAGSLSV